MTLKFTLLGLEISSKPKCERSPQKTTKMVNKKFSTKQLAQQKKFKKGIVSCHASTKTKEAFGKCLSKKLTKTNYKKTKKTVEKRLKRRRLGLPKKK